MYLFTSWTPFRPIYVPPPFHSYAVRHVPFQTNPYPFIPYRTFPPVNPSLLMNSAKKLKYLLEDAGKLAEKIAGSSDFSTALMSAAQESKTGQVEQIIRSSGIRKMPKINYTPDSLHLDFSEKVGNIDCCHASLMIR